MSVSGENEFAKGWILGGDIQLQKGSHDRDLSASVMLRKVWEENEGKFCNLFIDSSLKNILISLLFLK